MALRTAVIGAGVVSDRHLSGIRANPRTELVAVCDLDVDRARESAKRYGIKAYFESAELFANESLDWVHICTPVETHVPLALESIEAGVPVLIEKPVAESVEAVETLMNASREQDVPVSVVHNHRFGHAIRSARERIETGALGEIRGVDLIYTGSTPPDTPNRGSWAFDLLGGEFEEGLPHSLYLALAIGGYPADRDAVSAHTALRGTYDRPFGYDGAQVGFETEEGVLCNVTVLSGTIPIRIMYVHGTDASIAADLVSQTLLTFDRDYKGSARARALNNLDQVVDRVRGTVDNAVSVLQRTWNGGWEASAALDSIYYQFDREVDALLLQEDPPVPMEEAWWTIALMEAIRDSAADRPEVAITGSPAG